LSQSEYIIFHGGHIGMTLLEIGAKKTQNTTENDLIEMYK
jgi:hypothetical protein